MKITERLYELRKKKGMTQEEEADYLSVSAQAVSKWESGSSLPELAMLPKLSSFFGVSTDYLLGVDLLAEENEAEEALKKSWALRDKDPASALKILEEALEKYPNNEDLLVNRLYVLPNPEAVIQEGEKTARITVSADLKLDCLRLVAEAYAAKGNLRKAEETISQIPDIYFTNLELRAALLKDLKAAAKQARISLGTFEEMLRILVQADASYKPCLEKAEGMLKELKAR